MTTTLAHFPMVNQLVVQANDGLGGDQNPRMNCVPSSDAACIGYLTGKHVLPDTLLDGAYGKNYKGGTAQAIFDRGELQKFGCDTVAV